MVTNLVEVVRIENKTAAHIGLLFEIHWLSQYPLPNNVIYDQGGEFVDFLIFRVFLDFLNLPI